MKGNGFVSGCRGAEEAAWGMQSRSNGMEIIIVWNPASSYEALGKARCDRAIGETVDRMTRIKDLEVAHQLRTCFDHGSLRRNENGCKWYSF